MDKPPDEEKVFIVFSFKRSDLVAMGIPQEKVDALRDDQIEVIAADIRKIYEEADIQGTTKFLTQMYLVFGAPAKTENNERNGASEM